MPRLSTAKILGLAVAASAVFVVGLLLLVNNVTKSAKEKALATVNADMERLERQNRGPAMLQAAAEVATPFVAHVGAGHFADAYELLAAPFRKTVTLVAFSKACRASPILVGARSVTLNRLRQQSAGMGATVEASGVLDSGAGPVPIGFVFLDEDGRLKILVMSLAGVPVLQGVAPR